MLLIERGPHLTYAIDGRRDHLRNQRLSEYGHNAGPPVGNPRVLVTPDGRETTIEPYEPGYHNNAAVVGGGHRRLWRPGLALRARRFPHGQPLWRAGRLVADRLADRL